MPNSVVNIVAILQSRMNAHRLPHKAIMSLAGKPLLVTTAERIKACKLINMLTVSTTNETIDDQVYNLCKRAGIPVFRDSRKNQINVDYKIALKYDADVIVKISINEPLIDPAIITMLVRYYIENQEQFDYVSNLHPATYPEGNEIEIVSSRSLRKAWELARTSSERENSTLFIQNNPDIFKLGNVKWETGHDYSKSHRWVLDY
ncbi:MAG: acylneuraminate cytidylyltransferase, partial [Ignavibacteriaceae bacterium]